jgi:uncharacterized protein DUF1876
MSIDSRITINVFVSDEGDITRADAVALVGLTELRARGTAFHHADDDAHEAWDQLAAGRAVSELGRRLSQSARTRIHAGAGADG